MICGYSYFSDILSVLLKCRNYSGSVSVMTECFTLPYGVTAKIYLSRFSWRWDQTHEFNNGFAVIIKYLSSSDACIWHKAELWQFAQFICYRVCRANSVAFSSSSRLQQWTSLHTFRNLNITQLKMSAHSLSYDIPWKLVRGPRWKLKRLRNHILRYLIKCCRAYRALYFFAPNAHIKSVFIFALI